MNRIFKHRIRKTKTYTTMTSSVPPSSPPIFPDLDLDDGLRHDSQRDFPSSPPASIPILTAASRKRSWLDFEAPSSDPLFSDDVLGLEDRARYDRPAKQKRMLRMPWFEIQHRPHLRPRSRVRKAPIVAGDSGVFMGSDASLDDGFDGEPALLTKDERNSRSHLPNPVARGSPMTATQLAAVGIIEKCVEDGNESIDLSSIGIEALTDAMLRPLNHLIKEPPLTGTEPPSEEEFRPLTPSLKLFLAGNRLTTLTPGLFQLENLTVLSLRGNQLSEISHAISSLKRLQELNISGNRIKVLPWALMPFIRSRNVIVRPNPLVDPRWSAESLAAIGRSKSRPTNIVDESDLTEGDVIAQLNAYPIPNGAERFSIFLEVREKLLRNGRLDLTAEMTLRLWLFGNRRTSHRDIIPDASECSDEPRTQGQCYLASTPITRFRPSGPFTSSIPDTWLPDFTHDLPSTPVVSESDLSSSHGTGAPTLFSLALATSQSNLEPVQLTEVADSFAANGSQPIAAALQLAADISTAGDGNEPCATCGRRFIVPWAEWIEWWWSAKSGNRVDMEENAFLPPGMDLILPFRRRACSEACTRVTGFVL